MASLCPPPPKPTAPPVRRGGPASPRGSRKIKFPISIRNKTNISSIDARETTFMKPPPPSIRLRAASMILSAWVVLCASTLFSPAAHAMVNKDNNGNWDKPTGSDLLDREVPGFFINLGPTGARALISRNAPCPASHVSPPHKLSQEFADSSLGVNLRSSNQRRATGWTCIPSWPHLRSLQRRKDA